MVNIIWGVLILAGIIYGFFSGNMNAINNEIISSGKKALDMILEMLPILVIWMGLMKIAEDSGLLKKISNFFYPILSKLFPSLPKENKALGYIASNIAVNMMGLGSAATPFGLKAMKEMQDINPDKSRASDAMITFLVLIIIFYGYKKKINIYDSFLNGAKEGLISTFNIFPSLIAMVFAINIFLKSNFIEFALGFLNPFFKFLNVPLEILPMALLRPISGSSTLVVMNNLFSVYGPDSLIGRLASIIQGCTDTTFYVMSLYFGSVKIIKTRYALKVGLFADVCGIVASIIIVRLFF